MRGNVCIWSLVLSMVSGVYWGSWDVFLTGKGNSYNCITVFWLDWYLALTLG
jgi:hypothetical protein